MLGFKRILLTTNEINNKGKYVLMDYNNWGKSYDKIMINFIFNLLNLRSNGTTIPVEGDQNTSTIPQPVVRGCVNLTAGVKFMSI